MKEVQPMAAVNGVVTRLEEARIPVMDRGFLYGDSVYEVFRTYDGVPLFMADHFDRLAHSASLISMEISQSREALIDEIRSTVQATGATRAHDLYVRYQITRGVGAVDLSPVANWVTLRAVAARVARTTAGAGALVNGHEAISGAACPDMVTTTTATREAPIENSDTLSSASVGPPPLDANRT